MGSGDPSVDPCELGVHQKTFIHFTISPCLSSLQGTPRACLALKCVSLCNSRCWSLPWAWIIRAAFLDIYPCHTTSHGTANESTTRSNCCPQLLSDWEARLNATSTGMKLRADRRAFWSAQKAQVGVFTSELPTTPGHHALPVSLPGGGSLGSGVYHHTPSRLSAVVWVPQVEKCCIRALKVP